MKIYLSGPMTGLPDFNRPAFIEAAKLLRSVGFIVWNPAESQESLSGAPWSVCMRACVAGLLESDWLVQLPGWKDSKGANLEYQIAVHLGIPVASWEVLRNHAGKVETAFRRSAASRVF